MNIINTHEVDMLIAQLLTKLLTRNQKEQMYLKMIKKDTVKHIDRW